MRCPLFCVLAFAYVFSACASSDGSALLQGGGLTEEETIAAFLLAHPQRSGQMEIPSSPAHGIPRVLYQTYRTTPLNAHLESIRKTRSDLNPELRMVLMNDSEADESMRETFTERVYRVYTSMPLPVMRADMWRYAVVYALGGIYADVDVSALRAIGEWEESDSCGFVVSSERDKTSGNADLIQWTFAAQRHNVILGRIIREVVARCEGGIKTDYEGSVAEYVGTALWTSVITAALGEGDSRGTPFLHTLDRHTARSYYYYEYARSNEHGIANSRRYSLCIKDGWYFHGRNIRHHFGSQNFRNYHSWTEERKQRFGVGMQHPHPAKEGKRK
jgi:hypothetical protein